jgi:hypothetical protein
MRNLILGILVAWSPAAFGEEPKFTNLKKEQKAPFDGKLLNAAAVSKLIVQDRFKVEQCNVEIKYQKKLIQSEMQLKYDLLDAKFQAKQTLCEEITKLKDDQIKVLSKQYTPPKTYWWVAGGFILGSVSSIAIMYAVKPGIQ